MQAKTILTVVSDDQAPADLDAAIAFCRDSDAHLSVLIVGAAPPPPVVTYGGLSADVWVEATEAARAKIAESGEALEAHLQSAGIPSDVATRISPSGMVDDDIGERARYADITLIAATTEAKDGITDHQIANGVLFHASKPLLVCRKPGASFPDPKRVVLAWDASREASKAAHDTIGLMRGADEVRILLIDPDPVMGGHGPEPGADIATYLARHGINVVVERVASSGQTIDECILRYSQDQGADLVVMGAYGHSRLRERIFGGTTEAMLKQSTVPVLMTH